MPNLPDIQPVKQKALQSSKWLIYWIPVDTCKCVTADFLFLQNQAAFLLRFAVSTQYPTLESVINTIYYRQQSSTPHPIYWRLYLLDIQVRKYLLHPTRRKSLSKNIDISKKELLLIWNQIGSLPGSSSLLFVAFLISMQAIIHVRTFSCVEIN